MNEPPVSMLKPKMRTLVVLAFCAVGFGGASAQPAPLYPYELQPGQSYAVEVAPRTYVIHRPAQARDYVEREWAGQNVAERYEWLFRYDVTTARV